MQKILPPTVQTNLGGRNFASCVALGRIFGATFRNACPPTRAQLRPLRPKAAEQSRAQAGGQRQRLRRNTYPGQRKTRSVSDLRSWPTSPDKKKYTLCDNLAKACTFFVRAWPSGKSDNCFRHLEKVITAFMAGLKNPHTCNIPAVVASVRIFESSVGREECRNSSTEEVEKAAGRCL